MSIPPYLLPFIIPWKAAFFKGETQMTHTRFSFSTLAACLWLGLFPLLFGGTYATLTHDKWIWMLLLTAFTLICFLADCLRRCVSGPRGRQWLPLLPALLLFAWIGLSAVFSAYPASVWWLGASPRREGLATQLCYLALFLVFFFSPARREPLLLSLSAGVWVFFGVTILQRAGGNPFGLYPADRSFATHPDFQGTLGNVDMGTGYLCLAASWLFAACPGNRNTRLRLICLSGGMAAVWLILTMQVQFGLLALGALAAFFLLTLCPRKARLPAFVLGLAGLLLLVWFWPGESGGLWEAHEVLHGRPRLSFGSSRLGVWFFSLLLAGRQWLFGSGPDTFYPRFQAFLAEKGLSLPAAQGSTPLPGTFDTPHNEYLAYLLNNGLPALLLFVALLVSALLPLPEAAQKKATEGRIPLWTRLWTDFPAFPAQAALAAWAVQAFFSFSVCLVSPLFWVTLGLCFSLRRTMS